MSSNKENEQLGKEDLSRELYKACRGGDIGEVSHLLFDKKADVNARLQNSKSSFLMTGSYEELTPIIGVARSGADDETKKTIMHLLMENKANINYVAKTNPSSMLFNRPATALDFCGKESKFGKYITQTYGAKTAQEMHTAYSTHDNKREHLLSESSKRSWSDGVDSVDSLLKKDKKIQSQSQLISGQEFFSSSSSNPKLKEYQPKRPLSIIVKDEKRGQQFIKMIGEESAEAGTALDQPQTKKQKQEELSESGKDPSPYGGPSV